MGIFTMLLVGFVPLLQVTFIVLLEEFLSGLTRCKRSGQKSRFIGVILIMWYQITGLITVSVFY
jgi:hypothetical protein